MTAEISQWAQVAAAVAAAFAALAAALNVWLQNRNARRTRAVDLLLKKEAEFDSERMHKKRAFAAKVLLAPDPRSGDIAPVLDFIESVASLVNTGDLWKEMAWYTFYYWFSHYYFACEAVIKTEQARDKAVWTGITILYASLQRVQVKQGGNPLPNNLPAATRAFLESEARLAPEPETKSLGAAPPLQ